MLLSFSFLVFIHISSISVFCLLLRQATLLNFRLLMKTFVFLMRMLLYYNIWKSPVSPLPLKKKKKKKKNIQAQIIIFKAKKLLWKFLESATQWMHYEKLLNFVLAFCVLLKNCFKNSERIFLTFALYIFHVQPIEHFGSWLYQTSFLAYLRKHFLKYLTSFSPVGFH